MATWQLLRAGVSRLDVCAVASQRRDFGALVLRRIILLVLQQLLHEDVKFLPQRLDSLVRVLPQLFAVFDLHLQQLPEFLVVILELLVAHGLAENIVTVALRLEALAGRVRILALFRRQVVEDEGAQVLDVVDVLHERLLVLLHQMRGLRPAGQ